jgi:hypothetical protein
MTGAEGFAARYPRVWHVIEAEGEGCETLYPAATLRRLAGVPTDGANREKFERVELADGGTAVLRPQLMRDEHLTPTLVEAYAGRPDLWRDHINQHVFFWLAADRRDRFVNACIRLRARGTMGPGPTPIVLEIDTAGLLTAYRQVAYFSLINTGSTVRGGARTRRDETTFRSVESWRGERPAELAIRAPVRIAAAADPPRPAER